MANIYSSFQTSILNVNVDTLIQISAICYLFLNKQYVGIDFDKELTRIANKLSKSMMTLIRWCMNVLLGLDKFIPYHAKYMIQSHKCCPTIIPLYQFMWSIFWCSIRYIVCRERVCMVITDAKTGLIWRYDICNHHNVTCWAMGLISNGCYHCEQTNQPITRKPTGCRPLHLFIQWL